MLYFDTLAMSVSRACATSVLLRGLPSARGVLQHRVELAVGGHLGDALAEARSQRRARRLLGEGDEHFGLEDCRAQRLDLVLDALFGRLGETGIIAGDHIGGFPG